MPDDTLPPQAPILSVLALRLLTAGCISSSRRPRANGAGPALTRGTATGKLMGRHPRRGRILDDSRDSDE